MMNQINSTKAVVTAVIFSISLLGMITQAEAHGGNASATDVHACVKNNKGNARIVDVAEECGNKETATHWAIIGPAGADGINGVDGADGAVGPAGLAGADGAVGPAGISGAPGPIGPAGADGAVGPAGTDGTNGTNGTSSYELAAANGFTGTEQEWLDSLKGADGAAGINGTNGIDGTNGTNGTNGTDGVDANQAQLDALQAQVDVLQALVDGLHPIVYEIGDTGPAGGIVFHVINGGLNGLEAAPGDQPNAFWCSSYGDIANVDNIGAAITPDSHSGAHNTPLMVAQCDAFSAAGVVANYVWPNGQTDGFLPNKEELNLLFNQRNVVGGFTLGIYWSSSEYHDGEIFAWTQLFTTGFQTRDDKLDSPLRVRTVRAF